MLLTAPYLVCSCRLRNSFEHCCWKLERALNTVITVWVYEILVWCHQSSDVCSRNVHIQCDLKRWTRLNSKRRLNTRQTVGYGITSSVLALRVDFCVGYAQNSLEFVSRSPLKHSVGRSFCLYTDSVFAQIGDSNDKCSSSLEVECWNEDETHAARQLATQF